MPKRFQSSGLTGINLKAFFRSILLIRAPGPKYFVCMVYDNVYACESMKSFMVCEKGADRSCLGTRPKPEVQGVVGQIRPASVKIKSQHVGV